MQDTRFLAFVRAVHRIAESLGLDGDVLADEVPLVGSYGQQLAAAQIYLSVRPRPVGDREKRLLKRLARSVVLTSSRLPRRRRAG